TLDTPTFYPKTPQKTIGMVNVRHTRRSQDQSVYHPEIPLLLKTLRLVEDHHQYDGNAFAAS
ncbi:MAG: hypothetical protein SF029_09015, partial [bacterium]|nr:hypothetical protein [bacterium]